MQELLTSQLEIFNQKDSDTAASLTCQMLLRYLTSPTVDIDFDKLDDRKDPT